MTKCRNRADLEAVIRQRINSALKNDVADLIKQEMQKAIDDVVYEAGTPTVYRRRKDKNGLRDEQNMTDVLDSSSCTIRVYNDTSASGKRFDPLDEKIEFGYNTNSNWYDEPRPFVDITQQRINAQSKKIKNMLQHAVDYGR